MNHQEGYFKGIRNTQIYYQYWLPDGDPKAMLMIVHGLAEHSGRYMNVVNYLIPAGYAVYAIDHIGHGKSDGDRAFVEQFQDYLILLKQFLDMIQAWQPEQPIFLVGHSMGGLIGAAFLLEHQDELSGAVLSAPTIKQADNISNITVMAGKLLSMCLPKMGLIQLDATGVSRDPAVVDKYLHDPLVYSEKISARLCAEILKTMQHVKENAGTIHLPIMIVQGSDDKLVDPESGRILYELVSSEDKTVKIYDGFYHEVFNEPEHEQVLNDVAAWLEVH